MDLLSALFDVVIHLDQHLRALTQDYGGWVYLILFLIIFCETGLVVTPFLPGDSLLFVSGTLAASGALEVDVLWALLASAAFSGDNSNYWIGRFLGPRVFRLRESRFFNPAYLEKTHRFYERHGGKTVVLARFLPILRTFAPFVAGVGRMGYRRFLAYSAAGGVVWIGLFVYGGYYFGNLPVVKQNLTAFILGIIFISVLPGVLAFVRQRLRQG